MPSILEEEADKHDSFEGEVGFPTAHWFGWQDDIRVMASELLGHSLEDFHEFCERCFSLKTTRMIVNQLIASRHRTTNLLDGTWAQRQ